MLKQCGETPTDHPGHRFGVVPLRALVDPAAGGGGGSHTPRSSAGSAASARRLPDPPDVEHRPRAPALDALRHLRAEPLVSALRYDARGKPRKGGWDHAADLAAEWLAEHLHRSNFVVLKRPPGAPHRAG